MKKQLITFFLVLTLIPSFIFAQTSQEQRRTAPVKKTIQKQKATQPKRSSVRSKPSARLQSQSSNAMSERVDNSELQAALDLAKNGNYEEASIQLFNLSRSPRYARERMQIKYLLGLMLYDMKMYQTAAFQFVDVVRDGNSSYIKKSLEKLSLAADQLGDETLLNYALSKVQLEDFPADSQDLLRYRIGEFQFKNGEYTRAAANFSAVDRGSALFAKSKYMEGLSFAIQNRNEFALRAYSDLLDFKEKADFTDATRVSAQLGLARTYYQSKDWDNAIQFYRNVPRDTPQWHDALFEMSWAQMRAAKFRSVLGNMHSLHSPYYEDFYIPESLLLRSIVYLYICQYDEMEKTLDLFKKIYLPVRTNLRDVLKANLTPSRYFREMDKFAQNYQALLLKETDRKTLMLPFLVARKIFKEADFSRSYNYIKKLREEKNKMQQLSSRWKTSPVGQYSVKILDRRISRAEESSGMIAKRYVQEIHRDLLELFKQHDFARFEMSNGRKEILKKQILASNTSDRQIDSDNERSFYIQNGYEYWPFQGEYWLDEIGNYYYLGKSRCE
jgi:TolA-binding protein